MLTFPLAATSAPWSSSSFTTSTWPCLEASIRGELPFCKRQQNRYSFSSPILMLVVRSEAVIYTVYIQLRKLSIYNLPYVHLYMHFLIKKITEHCARVRNLKDWLLPCSERSQGPLAATVQTLRRPDLDYRGHATSYRPVCMDCSSEMKWSSFPWWTLTDAGCRKVHSSGYATGIALQAASNLDRSPDTARSCNYMA